MNTIKTFVADERGAITVNWLALSAACIGMGLAATYLVSAGAQDATMQTEAAMSSYVIDTEFDTVD